MNADTRIDAIKALLANDSQRREKASWKNVFESDTLTPAITDSDFEIKFIELLEQEASEGYRRKDELLRTKNRRRASYTPSQMYITSSIGRYIFAVMEWHSTLPAKAHHNRLVALSEAFSFKIDPEENHLQMVSDEERSSLIEQKEDEAYDKRNMAMIVAGIGGLISVLWYVIRRIG